MAVADEHLTWRAVTPDRWDDLETLFGANGAYSGCWCMWFRVRGAEYHAQARDGGAGNREALRAIVARGEVPGILAYDGETPIGWCSVARRDAFPQLERSRVARRQDEMPVWSAVCFFVHRGHRGQGVMAYLVRAAIEYVRTQGGGVIEAYPRRDDERIASSSGYVGLLSVFTAAGFAEIAQPTAHRVIVRYTVQP